MKLHKVRLATIALLTAGFAAVIAQPASFTHQVFATGGAIGATSPDSVTFGDGSVWIAYQDGADSTGIKGSSTVARYSPGGALLHTWTVSGNVDGLKVSPTGLVWALQNNDGNSALTVINPATNATTAYKYGSSYTNVSARGFDDVVFTGGKTFLSETNPASSSDPIVVQLTSGLSNPLEVSGMLNSSITGTNLATGTKASTAITDPDSLKLSPSGDLVLTGEADQTLVWIHNPGGNQSVSFLPLLGPDGKTVSGKPDDTIFPNATGGFFYIADTGANTVYRFTATGLTPGSVYVDVGKVFGVLNLSTGVVTPIFTGVSPHGAEFVSSSAPSVPEPVSLAFVGIGLVICGAAAYRRRNRRG